MAFWLALNEKTVRCCLEGLLDWKVDVCPRISGDPLPSATGPPQPICPGIMKFRSIFTSHHQPIRNRNGSLVQAHGGLSPLNRCCLKRFNIAELFFISKSGDTQPVFELDFFSDLSYRPGEKWGTIYEDTEVERVVHGPRADAQGFPFQLK